MKNIKYIILFAMGILLGGGMCTKCTDHSPKDATRVQSDTIYIHDTIRYSRLELKEWSHRLSIPQVGNTDYVYIPSDSVTTIYRDNTQYVTLPRQFFYTETEDAQIWHSGIDSTIDSLQVFSPRAIISTKVKPKKDKRHSIGFGIEANYSTAPNFPVQLEYAYHIREWFSIYGYAEYELLRKQMGIGIGTKVEIGW